MTGRLSRNLRKGHLAEDIGISVLRGFSAVSAVRQQDDVGIDAFATLLRLEKNMLYAGLTFAVQFKAQSVKEITYNAKQTEWFKKLEIPFFIARVDSYKSTVELYCTAKWNKYEVISDFSQIEFAFDDDYLEMKDHSIAHIGMSPPILRCTEIEARTDDFAERAYSIMTEWVEFEKKSIELRKFGIYRCPKWKTGESPEEFGVSSITCPSERRFHLEGSRPIVEKLMFHAYDECKKDASLRNAFLRIHKWFISEGVTEGALDCPEVLERYNLKKT